MTTPSANTEFGDRKGPGWLMPTIVLLGLFFAVFLTIAMSDRLVPESPAIAATTALRGFNMETFNAAHSGESDLRAFDRPPIPSVAEVKEPEAPPTECNAQEGKVVDCTFD